MKYGLYTIEDKINGFMSINTDVNDPSAVRNFSLAVSQSGSVINHSPSDFALYKVGEFDTESGNIDTIIPPKFIVNGSELVR